LTQFPDCYTKSHKEKLMKIAEVYVDGVLHHRGDKTIVKFVYNFLKGDPSIKNLEYKIVT
jgi:hypothetical protein